MKFTNDYEGMKWVRNVDSEKMDLPDLAQDSFRVSVTKMFPGVQVIPVEKTTYADIVRIRLATATAFVTGWQEKSLADAAEANPATLLISCVFLRVAF